METFPNNSKYRPIFHITPKKGWINDPNGFSYFSGKYHVYAQYNPKDTKWGPMHWLHFTSDDLLHWKEEGISLKPSKPYDKKLGCFSGSIVVKEDLMYAYYTGAKEGRQVQCLAISKDGHKFKKYKGNPILKEEDLPDGYLIGDFRDPKVFLRDETYYMLLAARHKDGYSSILLYQSEDLINFKFVGVVKSFHDLKFTGMVECPDIIFQGNKCALIYSLQNKYVKDDPITFSIWYQVGKIDLANGKFTPTGEERKLDEGFDAYASQTISLNNKNYIVYWASTWGINYPTSVEGYAGQLSLFKEVVIDGNKVKMKFLEGTPISRVRGKLTGYIGKVYINNICLEFNKLDSTLKLERKNLDVAIINDNGQNVSNKTIHISEVDTLDITCSLDNSCVEISINEGEIFATIVNIKKVPNIDIETENISLL